MLDVRSSLWNKSQGPRDSAGLWSDDLFGGDSPDYIQPSSFMAQGAFHTLIMRATLLSSFIVRT